MMQEAAAHKTASEAAPLLEVRDMTVQFFSRHGTLTALDDVSFAVRSGEVLGIVGESGAGKSLTGASIVGLLPGSGRVTAGEIRLGEQRIDNLDRARMRRIRGREIGLIFQDPQTSLNPLLTVGKQLVQTITSHLDMSAAAARQRGIELLRDVGIPAPERRIDSYPHQFSGGMRQRVVIALALCADPRLVIADEPTTALDVSIQAQVLALLQDLVRKRGLAIMLITHDMGVIAEAADRIAVMYAGRIVEIGPVRQVIDSPSHPYTAGLMSAIPRLGDRARRLVQIDGNMPRLDAIPSGCAFNPRCPRVMDICRVERPQLRPTRAGHAACHLYPALPQAET